MSVWTRIGDFVSAGAARTAAFGEVLRRSLSSAARADVAFTIAMIALSAKMAKADGVVTSDEIAAFQQVFTIPKGEERNVSRIFNLAKGDVAGFDAYAKRVAQFYGPDSETLEDILDSLFHIAKADGVVHERELAYLAEIARIFGLDEARFESLRARHTREGADPYVVLGARRDWTTEALRAHYLQLVQANHPDRLTARGVPEECIAIATERLAAITMAWAEIERERRR